VSALEIMGRGMWQADPRLRRAETHVSPNVLVLLVAATVLYGLRGATALGGLLGRRVRPALDRATLLGAVGCHAAFLVVRAIEGGGIQAGSRLDSVAFFLWLTAVVFLLAARPYRIQAIAPVFWPCLAAGMVAMWALAGREAAEPASFGKLWLTLHLVPVYLGYAGFAIAAGAGGAYLVQERLLRRKGAGAPWRLLPSLETLQRVEWAALSLGYPVFTVGLVAGILWAYQTRSPLGGAWYADPKVLGGLVVWLFYTAALHLRLFLRLRGRRAALLTVVGFLFTLLSFGTAHLYGDGGRGEGTGASRGSTSSPRPEPVEGRARPEAGP